MKEQIKPKTCRKKIIKSKNQNKNKNWFKKQTIKPKSNSFFKKSIKLIKLQSEEGREKRETCFINIGNERGNITTNPTDIKGIIREYHEQFCAHKFYNLDGMDKCLGRYKLPRFTKKNPKDNLDIPISTKEIECVV